jgi:hypothetical protein
VSIPTYTGQVPNSGRPDDFPADTDAFLPWMVSAFAALAQLAILGDGTTRFVQSSATDATAGRLMTPGAFGWGGVAPLLTITSNAMNSVAVSGLHRVTNNADVVTSGGPSAGVAGILRTERYSSNAAIQTYSDVNGRSWSRYQLLGTWSSWFENYTANTAAILSLGALGFAAGAGGSVTQAASKANSVTLNKSCGQITTSNSALASGASAAFTVNNSFVDANDTVLVTFGSDNLNYRLRSYISGFGTFVIVVENLFPGSLSDALNINFAVIEGVTS